MIRALKCERTVWGCMPVTFVRTGKLKAECYCGGMLRVAGRRKQMIEVIAPPFGGSRGLKALGNAGRLVMTPLVLLGDGLQNGGQEISVLIPDQVEPAVVKAVLTGLVGLGGRFGSLEEEIQARILPPLCMIEPAIRVFSAKAERLLLEAKAGAIMLRRRSGEEVAFIPIVVPPVPAIGAFPEIREEELVSMTPAEEAAEV